MFVCEGEKVLSKTRIKILEFINNNAGFRLDNVNRSVGSVADKELLGEALGFRSLCLFSGLDDKELKRLWDNSNLEFSL
jgi:hypothetical protein